MPPEVPNLEVIKLSQQVETLYSIEKAGWAANLEAKSTEQDKPCPCAEKHSIGGPGKRTWRVNSPHWGKKK